MSEEAKTPAPGAFIASLKRNNSKIREDRAIAISEDCCAEDATLE